MRENGATSGAGVLATFQYDDLGRRSSLTRGNGVVTSYTYDAVSRLVSLAHNATGTTHDLTLGFTYNPASQIASTTRSNPVYSWTAHGSGTTGSTINGLNQLAAHAGATPTYDAKGNLTSEGGRTFAFSSENLLTGIAPPGAVAAAVDYTPLMRTYSVYQAGGSPRTHYLHHGGRMIGEYFLGNLAGRHVHGPGTDEPLVTIGASGVRNWLTRRRARLDRRGPPTRAAPSRPSTATTNMADRRAPHPTASAIPARWACTAASTTTRRGPTIPSSAGSCSRTRSATATG